VLDQLVRPIAIRIGDAGQPSHLGLEHDQTEPFEL